MTSPGGWPPAPPSGPAAPTPAPYAPFDTGRPRVPVGRRPSVAPTAVVTPLFGLFGLIPALLATRRARDTGHPERPYWIAFGIGMVVNSMLTAALVVLVFAGLWWAVGESIDDGSPAAGTPVARVVGAGPAVDCAFTPDTSGRAGLVDVGLPPSPVPASGSSSLVLTTDGGPIGLVLDRDASPCAVASFRHLAAQGFFDGTGCHREGDAPGLQLLQCGDPTGTGTGGSSYTFPTQLTGRETYLRGTVAMANSGNGEDGSQFFLVFGDSQLPPQFTVVGSVNPRGLQVLDAIAAAGNDGSLDPVPGGGRPLQPVTIRTAVPGR